MADYHVSVREWPRSEQPREKLANLGESQLSTAELLAILLRVGTQGEDVLALSQRLLVTHRGLTGLARLSLPALQAEHGLGLAKAVTIKAALELGRRLMLDPGEQRLQVRSPTDVANLIMLEMVGLDHECLRTILLNTKNMVIASPVIYKGSVNTTGLRVGEVFKEAIRQNCPAMIVVHNHPSGDPTPSPEDISVTREIVQAGRLLDIEVLDHLVIGHHRYVSLKERGLGFS
jgi:DNA repair protein RadC